LKLRIFRSKEDWKLLLVEQKESGKTIVDFCKEKRIHTNMFYRKKKELGEKNSFVKLPKRKIHSGLIRIKIKDIIIEPELGCSKEELISVINTVLEAANVKV
jgi:hypothetical protein